MSMSMSMPAAAVDNRYVDEIPFPFPPSSGSELDQRHHHHQAIVADHQTSGSSPPEGCSFQPTKEIRTFLPPSTLYTREEISALLLG
jgi:hypothetical protein